jgi:hypothetical protein
VLRSKAKYWSTFDTELRNYGAAADGGLQEVNEGRRRHTTYEKERHYIDNYAEQTRKKI